MKKYRLLEKIADGCFGEVIRAKRRADGKIVAIKFLLDLKNLDARHRFEREVRMVNGQDHPNIMRILDFDLTAERPYYVMPFMQGGPLTNWAGKLSFESVRAVLKRLVDVLAYLHANGSLHRDLKPDNVLVDDDGNVVLGDFGLGNNPQFTVMFTVSAAGTDGYIAPELFGPQGAASQASDVFSLGATLFHLITGVHPRGLEALDPKSHVSDVPDDLRDLVMEMTAHEPRHRPSAAQLCRALGISVPVVSSSNNTNGGFTPRRRRTTLGGGRYA